MVKNHPHLWNHVYQKCQTSFKRFTREDYEEVTKLSKIQPNLVKNQSQLTIYEQGVVNVTGDQDVLFQGNLVWLLSKQKGMKRQKS